MSLTRALKWSFLSELASKLIQPVVFVILARLLTPEDFGVMSAALMVMAFSQIFWEAGMGKALIQRQTDIESAANISFWVNLGLALLIAGLLYTSASTIALTFFQDPRVTSVIQVMTAQVFLGALGSVQTALLQKSMRFKKLFWVRFATVSLPGLASIPLAWQGMGYWALVAGALVGQAVQVAMLWRMSSWRPNWSFNVPVAKEMGHFGAWVGLSGFVAWLFVWLDTMIVAKYLGPHDLGIYWTGNQLVSMVFMIIFGTITPVFYSHISKKTKEEIQRTFPSIIVMITYLSLPTGILIYAGADLLEAAIFTSRWKGIGDVIEILSITFGLTYIVAINGEVYRAINKPKIETIVMLSALFFYIPIYLFSIKYGMDNFLWARLFAGVVGVAIQLYFLNLVLGISVQRTVFSIAKVACISGIFLTLYTYASTNLGTIESIFFLLASVIILAINLYMLYGKEKGIANLI